MPGPGFAVIDFETTGLFPGGHDRVVEVAVVHLDARGAITGRWETLVNPQRDLGAQHIHGIRAADVMQAPTFADIAGHLVELLDSRVLVAHNASFDSRFLTAELTRAGYVPDLYIDSICTMRLATEIIPGAGRSLADCCAAYDIELDGAHRASVDALATAQLLAAYMGTTDAEDFWFSHVDTALNNPWPELVFQTPRDSVWRPRELAAAPDPSTFLQRITIKLPDFAGPAEHQDYLALLDRCLIDHHISAHEANALVALADDLGISRDTCARLHHDYFAAVARVAWDDGVLTPGEIGELSTVAALLSIDPAFFTQALQRPSNASPVGGATQTAGASTVARPGAFTLKPGDHVVITGELTRPRDDWHRELEARGFIPRPAISKKIALVVAADPDSLSGKARKARDYGIPIVNEAGLRGLLSV